MSRARAIVLAVLTAWPLLYVMLFVGIISWTVMSAALGSYDSDGPPMLFRVLFVLHFLTMVEMVLLLVVYIVYLLRTDRIAQDKKALWAVVLFCGNMIAMPVFWYLYIWKEPGAETPEDTAKADD